ncbi:MAG: leucyl aminopeptidase [Bdellovibrio sp.]|nr:leucyl aminopeptidase [Bdellovibrio sp.]
MNIKLSFNDKNFSTREAVVFGVYTKNVDSKTKGKAKAKKKTELVFHHWPKEIIQAFNKVKTSKNFKGGQGESTEFNLPSGSTLVVLGLGDKEKFTSEILRRETAGIFKQYKRRSEELAFDLDTLMMHTMEQTVGICAEAIWLANYSFETHMSKKNENILKSVVFMSSQTKAKEKKIETLLKKSQVLCESINLARDWVNEPPNILNSEEYAKRIEQDAKKISGVKIKILGKEELKKENMGMFLSVNAGSAFKPQLVHLTYSPKKATKHIALVGKGLTFDTGGYCLKPSTSIANMKFDMAGSATVYAAFRTLVLNRVQVKITCVLGITDNAINSLATKPDSIVKARNGKTVEILNTDAEGRLLLGDCLDYVCDLKPDAVIDAATLTGACLVALGSEICGLMGNNQKLMDKLLSSSKACDEYMWQLPIIPEFHKDIKSPNADLKNIGSKGHGGTCKAAAFLESFVKKDIPWAHLDIAGVADSQSHLPYTPKHGASGLMVRTLVNYIENV